MFDPGTDSARTASRTAEGITAARLSRRGVVRAGVWAVPAVSLAAAAPAYAGSGSNSVEFFANGTSVTAAGPWQDLNFSGARLRIWGTPDPNAVLTMTVSFVPFPDQAIQEAVLVSLIVPPNWATTQLGQTTSLVTFTYAFPVTNGATVVIPDGIFVGTFHPNQRGTFYVAFTLPGLDPAVAAFASGPAQRSMTEPNSSGRATRLDTDSPPD